METKTFRAFIVDDEEFARDDLKSILSRFPNVEIIGEADSVLSASNQINRLQPDLIFLDIQFPGETGFDLFNKIDSSAKIIFVTAFDEHAIRAFEVNAQDYLLKPVNPERLALSLERLEEAVASNNKPLQRFNNNDTIFLELNNRYHFIKISTIIKIEAANNYTEILTSKGAKGLTNKTMKEWELRLPEDTFIRIHRSTIINADYVVRVEPWFSYAHRVYMQGQEKPLVMSRRHAAKLHCRFS